MTTQSPVPADHPLMVAWTTYQRCNEFANAEKWAANPAHLLGSLWCMFAAGWRMAQPSIDEQSPALRTAPTDREAKIAAAVALAIRDVAELPDRESPEEWPEAMLVTGSELETILTNRLRDCPPAPDGKALRALRAWVTNHWRRQTEDVLSTSQSILMWKHAWNPLLAEIDRLTSTPVADAEGAPAKVYVHKVTQTGEHFCETQCEVRKDYRSGSAKLVTKVAAMEADLADLRAENARLQADLAALEPPAPDGKVLREKWVIRSKALEGERDAAIAQRDKAIAQNTNLATHLAAARADQAALARAAKMPSFHPGCTMRINGENPLRAELANGPSDDERGLYARFRRPADAARFVAMHNAALPQPKPAAEPVPPQVAPVALDTEALMAWAFGGDTGLSSKCIAATVAGVRGDRHDYPHDMDDFGRCQRLVDTVPGVRERLPDVAALSNIWCRIVLRWDEIVARGGDVLRECIDGHPITPAQQQALTAAIPPLPSDKGRVRETVAAAGDEVRDAHDRVFLAALMDWLIDNPGMDPARTLHAISTKVLARRALAGKEPKP